ncbi:hypothetical protein HanIR_Chr08g0383741 [Helianthus annuus]|nr:hypothetical protein HanIR_Chr08g0383741 [Helianthus annuus]
MKFRFESYSGALRSIGRDRDQPVTRNKQNKKSALHITSTGNPHKQYNRASPANEVYTSRRRRLTLWFDVEVRKWEWLTGFLTNFGYNTWGLRTFEPFPCSWSQDTPFPSSPIMHHHQPLQS